MESNLPEKRNKGGVLSEIFGQFATLQFWRDLVRVLVQEAIATFLMTLGGTLIFYGRQRRNKDVEATVNQNPGQSSPTAQKAFGGYQPSTSYQPGSSSYPVQSTPNGDARFPGFGSGR